MLVDPPHVFYSLLKVIYPIVDPVTKQKLKMLKGTDQVS